MREGASRRRKGRTLTRALWAQDLWSLSSDLKLTVGGRYEQWRASDGLNVSASPALNAHQPELSKDTFSPKAVLAWSPLGGGRLFAEDDEAAGRVRAAMATLAEKYGGPGGHATPGQLALAWVLAHPAQPVAVLGTSSIDRIASLARACEITLERHDWYLLWQAAAGRKIP